MSRKMVGVLIPILLTGGTIFFSSLLVSTPSIRQGIFVGMAISLVQSFLSMAALRWAWKKTYFYWVWGGAMLMRLLVFAATAFVVMKLTHLNLAATLISVAVATMVFLVSESLILLGHLK